MEIDSAVYLAKETAHALEEAVELCDRVEAYEICGQGLREAYVGLKRLRYQDTSHPDEMAAASSQAAARLCSHPADSTEDSQLGEVESKLGPSVLQSLEESISQDDFAAKMQRARECPHSDQGSEELDALLDGFVVITKEDAVEAMASYLAAWLSSVPEAQNMDPKKLQRALLTTVKDLKKTRFRQVLQWGRYAYRGATFAYSAFMVYENPWLVQAVVTALWSAGTVVVAAL